MKLHTVLICFAVIFTGALAWKVSTDASARKRAESEAAIWVQIEQEKTRQFQIFAEALKSNLNPQIRGETAECN